MSLCRHHLWTIFSVLISLLFTTANVQAQTLSRTADVELYLAAGHDGPVYSVAFSPDGKSLASGSGDNSIKLWRLSAEGASEYATLTGHKNWVSSIAFSPDGTSLASGSWDNSIKLWRLTAEGASEYATLTGHKNWVRDRKSVV